jgi:hypothetical protein
MDCANRKAKKWRTLPCFSNVSSGSRRTGARAGTIRTTGIRVNGSSVGSSIVGSESMNTKTADLESGTREGVMTFTIGGGPNERLGVEETTHRDKAHNDVLTAALATMKFEKAFLASDEGRMNTITTTAFAFANAVR